MRGFEDSNGIYHNEKDCPEMVGSAVRSLPMTKAMKWGKEICDNCVE